MVALLTHHCLCGVSRPTTTSCAQLAQFTRMLEDLHEPWDLIADPVKEVVHLSTVQIRDQILHTEGSDPSHTKMGVGGWW